MKGKDGDYEQIPAERGALTLLSLAQPLQKAARPFCHTRVNSGPSMSSERDREREREGRKERRGERRSDTVTNTHTHSLFLSFPPLMCGLPVCSGELQDGFDPFALHSHRDDDDDDGFGSDRSYELIEGESNAPSHRASQKDRKRSSGNIQMLMCKAQLFENMLW